jgi:hypothetical protein
LLPISASGQGFDQTFLSDYSKLESHQGEQGVDYVYKAPGVFDNLAKYTGVMVDQPEVLISPDSKYKGGKPGDLMAIAETMRQAVSDQLTASGYASVEEPGPGIIYIRLALTDVRLVKKKRGFFSYTPVGAIAKAAKDSGKEMMAKVDMTHVAVQAELTDSVSGEVLAAQVAVRDGKKMRMAFEELDALLTGYGARIACRLDNAQADAGHQTDCLNLPAPVADEK